MNAPKRENPLAALLGDKGVAMRLQRSIVDSDDWGNGDVVVVVPDGEIV